MFSIKENKKNLKFEFSSSMSQVDRVIEGCRDFWETHEIKSATGVEHVLRELLINAIEHGNREDSSKKVFLTLDLLKNQRIKVTVNDEGEGFDPANVSIDPPKDTEQKRNRGYGIINSFADEIVFGKQGNPVTVYVSIPRETEMEIKIKGKEAFLIVSSDISAAIADQFRLKLISLFDAEIQLLTLDFLKVENIDSISLSVLICFAKEWNEKHPEKGKIVNMNKELQNLFYMTKMNELFDIA